MRKLIFLFSMSWACFVGLPGMVHASEVDILVKKLVEKKILTQSEAQEILHETKKEAANEKAQIARKQESKNKTTEEKSEVLGVKEQEVKEEKVSSLPEWIKKFKIHGDLRLRYQANERDQDANQIRHRGRYRFRLGMDIDVMKNLQVKAGLASGAADPRSTNQTFTDNFSTPDVRLDYAYIEYKLWDWLSFYGGQFQRKNLIWEPSDQLWDSDITLQGAGFALNKDVGHDVNILFNTGVLVLDEFGGNTRDPFMYFFQPGVEAELGPVFLQVMLAYYGFADVKGGAWDANATNGTNTLDANGNLASNYNAVSPSVEIGNAEAFDFPVHYVRAFGEYVYNPDPANNNQGFVAGIKVGDKKVKDANEWQFRYMYRYLETDAWPDVFPNADFYNGETNSKGHGFIFEYALHKNVSVGSAYYFANHINGADQTEHVFQLDTLFMF